MFENVIFLTCLYFIQGLPYGLQARFLPVYFRSHGMSLTDISLFKLLLTPWMLKALWAPFVDKYGSKKSWLAWSMVGLIFTCLTGAFTPPKTIVPLAIVLFLFNLLTSTQDIAVDGIAIHVLSEAELGYGNIAQVVGYKLGSIFGGGVLIWLSDYFEWSYLLFSLAFVYVISLMNVAVLVPSTDNDKKNPKDKTANKKETLDEKPEKSWFIQHFIEIFQSPGTWWMIGFVLVYKLGEQGALSMLPLFLLDKGIAASSVGFWTGVVGQVLSILGSIVGGGIVSTSRMTALVLHDICAFRLIPMLFTTLVIFSWVDKSQVCFVLAIISMCLMLLTSGIVTTATFTLMMQCSKKAPDYVQASHYTTLATLEVLGKLAFSVVLGSITDAIGYEYVFIMFLVLSVMAILFIQQCPEELIKSEVELTVKKNE
ncbi:major facilitator superfamily domain-containing protein 3-like [Saccostrea cucullata]|uniref:major facilitator superfamily domain-containing protein 3-like n=1 Tax=Saccostrea cuccullata TaxID=36930 RepID=UPI002ED6213F